MRNRRQGREVAALLPPLRRTKLVVPDIAPALRPAGAAGRRGGGPIASLPGRSDERQSRLARLARRLPFWWLLISAFLAVADVALSASLLRENNAVDGNVAFNFATLGVALGLSLGAGLLWPRWWRRLIAAAAILPVPILLATSHNLAAGATVIALLLPMVWLGHALAARLFRAIGSFDAWVVGTAFGLGAVGLLGLVLGVAGSLRPQFIWPAPAIVMLCLFVWERDRLWRDVTLFGDWLKRPTERHLIVLVFAGIVLASLWLNLMGALAPEIRSDATRQRLATAVHFAKSGSLAGDPELGVARTPALGEIIYAVAVAAGPIQGAKLIHWLAGLCCAAAVFALGRRLGGDWAGALAAFAFYTALLVSYLSQTAYLALLATLFTTVAALLIVRGAGTNWRVVAGAGACLGLSVVIKTHFGYVAAGLAVPAAILAARIGWRRATIDVAVLTLAALLAASPWLIRSQLITGTVPGVQTATFALSGGTNGGSAVKTELLDYGFGRSPVQLVTVPLSAVLMGARFGGAHLVSANILGGHVGFLPLGLVPLLLLRRRHRRIVAIGAGAATAYIGWFYSMQYLRYALPIVALLCAAGGAAYLAAWRKAPDGHPRATLNLLLSVLALASTFVSLQLPTAQRFAFGLQDREGYLAEWLGPTGDGSYAVLKMLDAEPGATRAFAMYDGARLYTHVRVSNPWTTASDLAVTGSDEEVLARLAAGGYSHILVNRLSWRGDKWSWDKMTVVDEDFLRRNAELVGGGGYSYLYRLVPPEERGKVMWARGGELLPDGGFEEIIGENPVQWAVTGMPRVDTSGAHSRTNLGAIVLESTDQIRTAAPVASGRQYLLSAATQGVAGYGEALLCVEWRDARDNPIATVREEIPVSPDKYHTFSLLATAPPGATTASVSAKVYFGQIWFDDFSLRSVADDSSTIGTTLP